jgi:hypothetical protein
MVMSSLPNHRFLIVISLSIFRFDPSVWLLRSLGKEKLITLDFFFLLPFIFFFLKRVQQN